MLTIDSNVPLPAFRRASMVPQNAELLEMMEVMQVGDSTYVNRPPRATVVFVSKRAKVLGRKFRTVKEGTGVRVFRLS